MATPFGDRVLGRTGLAVGPLGLSSSYGMPTAAVEEAFERGMNYLYWGSFRRDRFGQAIRNLKRQRERMVVVIQSYSPNGSLIGWSLDRALRSLQIAYADVLLLGYWNKPVRPAIIDACKELQAKGKVRYLAVSSHNRPVLDQMANEGIFDILHLRYNAAHRGAEQEIFGKLPPPPRAGIVAYTATSWSQLLNASVPGEKTPTAGDCYRFALTNPAVDLCMTGTGTLEQTRHALDAMRAGPMTAEELAWMRRIGDSLH